MRLLRTTCLALSALALSGCLNGRSVNSLLQDGLDYRPDRTDEVLSAIRADRAELVQAFKDGNKEVASAIRTIGSAPAAFEKGPPDSPPPVSSLALSRLEDKVDRLLSETVKMPPPPEADEPPPGPSEAVKQRATEPQRTTFRVYAPSWCGPCQAKIRAAQAEVMASRGSVSQVYEFHTNQATFPQALRDQKLWTDPIVQWDDSSSPTGKRQWVGWPGLVRLLQIYAAPSFPKAKVTVNGAEVDYSASTMTYFAPMTTWRYYGTPMRQQSYSSGLFYTHREWGQHHRWDGDLRQHLIQAHGWDASNLTDLQAVEYHDSLREGVQTSQKLGPAERKNVRRYGHL